MLCSDLNHLQNSVPAQGLVTKKKRKQVLSYTDLFCLQRGYEGTRLDAMVATDCEPQKEDHQSKQLPEAEQHDPAQDRDLARKIEQERRRREAVSC